MYPRAFHELVLLLRIHSLEKERKAKRNDRGTVAGSLNKGNFCLDSTLTQGVGGIISKNRDESFRKSHEESSRKFKTGQQGIISKFNPREN